MTENKRELQPISSPLLEALGGHYEEVKPGVSPLVEGGAFLWGTEDPELGKGIFRHTRKASRVAYFVGKALQEKGIKEYQDVDLSCVVQAALLHDITKLRWESLGKLSLEQRRDLGLPEKVDETSVEAREWTKELLQDLGVALPVQEVVTEHGFPQESVDDPLAKLIYMGDFMTGQEIMPVEDRLEDVRNRWIEQRQAKGLAPKIDPAEFERAAEIIGGIAREIFESLGTTDKDFIKKHKLNSDESEMRWERFLRETQDKEKESRVKELFKLQGK